jgi:hypothetical protein
VNAFVGQRQRAGHATNTAAHDQNRFAHLPALNNNQYTDDQYTY